jgi:hypothetical protein
MATGLAVILNGSNQHRVKPHAVAAEHISEQAVTDHGYRGRWHSEIANNEAQCPTARLSSPGGEAHPQLISHCRDPIAGGVVAEQMQLHAAACIDQPVAYWAWQGHIATGQKGAVDVNNRGPQTMGSEVGQ